MSANDKQIGGTHYATAIQTWDFITTNNIPYLEGNAIKYIARHREKGGAEDLRKAQHYIEKMLETYYPAPIEFPIQPCEHRFYAGSYKHDKDGRLRDVMVCSLCGAEQQP